MGKRTKHSLTTVQTNKGSVTIPRLYIDCFYRWFSTWNTIFCSLFEISFYISLKKPFLEADLSYDRSHRLSNGRDRRANVRAMTAFTGMLLNFNISNLFKLWRFFILDVV